VKQISSNENQIAVDKNKGIINYIKDGFQTSNENYINQNFEINLDRNIENKKKDYRKFVLNKLIYFTNKYNKLAPENQYLFHCEDFCYDILDIVLLSRDKEEKIDAINLLANLTYISNDIVQSITDVKIIDAFIGIIEKNNNSDDLEKNILHVIGNMIIINTNFVLNKSNFLEFYVRYIFKNYSSFNSTIIWFNGILMDLIDIYMIDDKLQVNEIKKFLYSITKINSYKN